MHLKILSIIPARSGSKSIPDKNIYSYMGKPLMAYSILDSLHSGLINRTMVSTDSEYYARIAESFGAEIPFIRPKEISEDLSTDFDVFEHALDYLSSAENYIPDIVVHLRPTYPKRNIQDINAMINLLISNSDWDSVRSVSETMETPFKMWQIENDKLTPVIKQSQIIEAYNQPRQILPKVYSQNACIDVTRGKTIMKKKSMTGNVIGAYVMKDNWDIDYFSDFNKMAPDVMNERNKVFCFDIDGVIAKLSPNNNYHLAEPNTPIIDKVNKLFDNNNTIILFTARGTKTGIDWSTVTAEQLKTWGVKYHELKFGKPAADYYVDDRLINMNEL
jgi:CMP-N,N'-diacetyllegionaminic acid synthase